MSSEYITTSRLSAADLRPRPLLLLYVLIFTCFTVYHATAAELTDPFTAWPKIPDRELSELRGGFITADGLNINIGLEQLVMIDGTTKSRINFNLSGGVQAASTGAGSAPSNQSKNINFVQNGGNNFVTPDVPANFAGGALTIIQNSQDSKLIQNFTMLNVDVSGLSQFRPNWASMNVGQQVVRSLH